MSKEYARVNINGHAENICEFGFNASGCIVIRTIGKLCGEKAKEYDGGICIVDNVDITQPVKIVTTICLNENTFMCQLESIRKYNIASYNAISIEDINKITDEYKKLMMPKEGPEQIVDQCIIDGYEYVFKIIKCD